MNKADSSTKPITSINTAGDGIEKATDHMHGYDNYTQTRPDTLEIRMKRQKDIHKVEYFDGIRINPKSLPKGKHMYHTRHSDNDISQPVTIAPEGTAVIVNFCGTIVTDKPLEVGEETKLMFVSWI